MAERTLLLIADAFYPAELPPECKTNTHLALALGRRGWDVAIWAGYGARIPPSSVNVRIVRAPKVWNLGEVFRIFMWLVKNKPTQIVLMYHCALYSCRSAINWIPIIALFVGARCITLFTNGEAPTRSVWQDRTLSALGYRGLVPYSIGPLGAADKIIFYSDANRKCLLGADTLNLKVRSQILNPPDTLPVETLTDRSSFRASVGLTDNNFLIGYFGLLYPGKGIEWLLEAMLILKSKGIDTKLILVGPNGGVTANDGWNSACREYEKSLKSKARDLDIEKMILWGGFYNDLRTVECLSSCDIACLPFDDGLSNMRSSFITCAHIGLPLITTQTSDTDEFLRDPSSGIIYVEPRNPAQIADSIFLLYKDPERTRQCGLMLKNFAAKHYSNERFVDCFDMA